MLGVEGEVEWEVEAPSAVGRRLRVRLRLRLTTPVASFLCAANAASGLRFAVLALLCTQCRTWKASASMAASCFSPV